MEIFLSPNNFISLEIFLSPDIFLSSNIFLSSKIFLSSETFLRFKYCQYLQGPISFIKFTPVWFITSPSKHGDFKSFHDVALVFIYYWNKCVTPFHFLRSDLYLSPCLNLGTLRWETKSGLYKVLKLMNFIYKILYRCTRYK